LGGPNTQPIQLPIHPMTTIRPLAVLGAAATVLALSPLSAGAQATHGWADAANGFRDDDVAWILPLLDAEVADAGRRGTMLATAAGGTQAGGSGTMVDVIMREGQDLLARMRSGQVDPLTLLRQRVDARYVVTPPGARYDAACSIALTEARQMVGDHGVSAAFTMGADAPASTGAAQPALARALSWYRANGFSYVAPANNVHPLAPRGDDRAMGVAVWEANILYAPLTVVQDPACQRLPTGPLVVISEPARGIATMVGDRMDASVAGQAERLPGALAQARLTAEEWAEVLRALSMARMQADAEAESPGYLEMIYRERPDDLARRRAAVAWYRRHGAAVSRRLDDIVARQGY
jgi:hypothetical protein